MNDVPSASDSARNLLLGILALQVDFISRHDLVRATENWLKDRSRSFDDVLVAQGAMTESERQLLLPIVQQHIDNHDDDPKKSLATLSSIGTLAHDLSALGNADVAATVSLVGQDRDGRAIDATIELDADDNATATDRPLSDAGSRFRVLRPHAKGGLGEVSVAKDLELNRDVALKEIQSRFADDQASRSRFMLEAEVTGGLEHPGIVPVYGLGQYADGRPFYTMRFIKGDSLQEAADRFHLHQTGERIDYSGIEFRKLLGRFVDVCQAIEYAHSRGVLHRDLKPGNIMLGKYGETLVVDWGLAKTQDDDGAVESKADEDLLRPASASGSAPTVMGTAIGTPAFMPPEQATGDLEQLGPASDVYSLGATLYYLLTGRRPFQNDDLAVTLADVRAGNYPLPRSIAPSVPKPLEALCCQAMSLNPADRYSSPLELADDIERVLADEAVSAYPEPLAMKAKRWLRKHPTLSVSTLAVVLVSAIGLGVSSAVVAGKNTELSRLNTRLEDKTVALQKSLEDVTRAENETASLNDFLIDDLLVAADPDLNPYQERTTVESLLDRAAERIDATDSFDSQPTVEASLRIAIGRTYLALGQWSPAANHLERAVALRRDAFGPNDPRTLDAIDALVDVRLEQEDLDWALATVLELEQGWDRIEGKEAARKLLLTRLKRSELLMWFGEYAAAESMARKVLQEAEQPEYDEEVRIRARQAVGDILSAQFKNSDEAFSLYEQNLQTLIDSGSEDHAADVLSVKFRMIEHLIAQAKPREAEQLCSEILRTRTTKTLPDDHPHTITARIVLGNLLMSLGRFNEGGHLLRTGHRQAVESLGQDHSTTWMARHTMAMSTFQTLGPIPNRAEFAERAEQLSRENVAVCERRNWAMEHSNTHQSRTNLAWALAAKGILGGDREPLTQGKELLSELYESYRERYGIDHTLTLGGGLHRIQIGLALGEDPDELRPIATQLWEAADQMPVGWPTRPNLAQAVGSVLTAQGQNSDAEPFLREYYQYCVTSDVVSLFDRQAGIEGLAQCLILQGREQQLEKSLRLDGGKVYRLRVSQEGGSPLMIVRILFSSLTGSEHLGSDEGYVYLAPTTDVAVSVSVVSLAEQVSQRECELEVRECTFRNERSFEGTISIDSEQRMVSDLPYESETFEGKANVIYQFDVETSDFAPNIWIENEEGKLLKWLVGARVPQMEFVPQQDGQYSVLVFPSESDEAGDFKLTIREYTVNEETLMP